MTKQSKSSRQSLAAAVERDIAVDRPLGAGESMSAKKKRRLDKEKQQLKLMSSVRRVEMNTRAERVLMRDLNGALQYFSMIDKTELTVEVSPPPSQAQKKNPEESDKQQLKDKTSNESERDPAQRTLAF